MSSRRADPVEGCADRSWKRLRGNDEIQEANPDDLRGRLRVERHTFGTAVIAPVFYVWDSDHDAALGWAQDLARHLPRRRPEPGSTRSNLTPRLQTREGGGI